MAHGGAVAVGGEHHLEDVTEDEVDGQSLATQERVEHARQSLATQERAEHARQLS